ncbi:MAG: glycosyltransferase family 2 protein [Candidatus Parcubacteria bacterium]|nr:glycosyltransferase family 2 protein [Candidatus Parcubacteria bacterium]
MIKISAIVITKNAENLIADCLDSLSFCEEIIVIDSNSDDRTGEIARKMGAKVFEHSFQDFSETRNFGLKKAIGEWVLYVDADERVTPELALNIKNQTLSTENPNLAFRIKRKNFYFGDNEWPYIEHLERLFKKNKLEGWYGKIHESPRIKGEIGKLDGYLLHYTHRDLSSMVKKTIEWSKTEAELRYKAGHPRMTWWRFPRVMITAFLDFYIRQGGWKVGVVGIIESLYQAFSIFITYARLWEMQEKLKIKNEK